MAKRKTSKRKSGPKGHKPGCKCWYHAKRSRRKRK
jgi:hypothetical protein